MFSLPFHVLVLAAGLISAAHLLGVGPTAASLGLPIWSALPFLWLGSVTSRLAEFRPQSRVLNTLKLASPLVVFAAFLYGTTWSTWVLSLTDFAPLHSGTVGLSLLPLFAPLLWAHLAICTGPSRHKLLPMGNPLDPSWRVRIPLGMWFLLLLLLAIGDLSSATPALQTFLYVSPLGQAAQLLVALTLAGILAPRALLWGMDLVPLEGHLRRRAEAMVAEAGVGSVRLYEWRTDGEIANAMVIGTPPSGATIVFTDRLLEQLGTEEFDAVLAHELGHIKGRHVRHFLVWILAALALTVALDTGSSLSFSGASLVGSLAGALALIMWISFVSRRFELEADLFASKVKPDGLTRALLSLGQSFETHHKNGFRHFSMSRRTLFIAGARADPGVGNRLAQTAGRIRNGGLFFLALSSTFLFVADQVHAPRVDLILAVQRGEFAEAADLLDDLRPDLKAQVDASYPSLELLLGNARETFGRRPVVNSEQLAAHSVQAIENAPIQDVLPSLITWIDLAILRSLGNAPGERHLRRGLVLATKRDRHAEDVVHDALRMPELEQPWREVARAVLAQIEERPAGL